MPSPFPGIDLADPTSDAGKVFFKNFQKIKDIIPQKSSIVDVNTMKSCILGAIESVIFVFQFAKNFNPQHTYMLDYLQAIKDQNIYISYDTGQIQVGASIMPYSTFVRNIMYPYIIDRIKNVNLALYLGVVDSANILVQEEASVYPPNSSFINGNKTGNLYT